MEKIINLPTLNKNTSELKEIIIFYVKYILSKLKNLVSRDEAVELIKQTSPEVKVVHKGTGNVISSLSVEHNVITAQKTSSKSTYPKVRWARNGHIDLDNCNDIDYILVPCRTKRLLLLVTNKYLKQLSETLNIADVLGYEDVPISSVLQLTSNWLADENTIIPNNELDDDKLPCDKLVYFLRNLKKSYREVRNLYLYTKKIYANRKRGFDNIVGDRSCSFLLHEIRTFNRYTLFFYRSDSEEGVVERVQDKPLIKVPYMIFRSPFTVIKGGGVIPVKDGKLLLHKARMCRDTDHFLLVSTGEILSFDHEGRCKNLLRPNYRKAWREHPGNYRRIFRGPNKDIGTCYNEGLTIFPRRGITQMSKLLMTYNRKKWELAHPDRPRHTSRMFPFIWKLNKRKRQNSHRGLFHNIMASNKIFWQLFLHLYVTVWCRFFNSAAWEYHHLGPINCAALRKSDLHKIETKLFDGTWRSSILCVGYGDPFGLYQTNRYAPVEKYKIKLNRDKQQLSIVKI